MSHTCEIIACQRAGLTRDEGNENTAFEEQCKLLHADEHLSKRERKVRKQMLWDIVHQVQRAEWANDDMVDLFNVDRVETAADILTAADLVKDSAPSAGNLGTFEASSQPNQRWIDDTSKQLAAAGVQRCVRTAARNHGAETIAEALRNHNPECAYITAQVVQTRARKERWQTDAPRTEHERKVEVCTFTFATLSASVFDYMPACVHSVILLDIAGARTPTERVPTYWRTSTTSVRRFNVRPACQVLYQAGSSYMCT